jgi:hypothetical protein
VFTLSLRNGNVWKIFTVAHVRKNNLTNRGCSLLNYRYFKISLIASAIFDLEWVRVMGPQNVKSVSTPCSVVKTLYLCRFWWGCSFSNNMYYFYYKCIPTWIALSNYVKALHCSVHPKSSGWTGLQLLLRAEQVLLLEINMAWPAFEFVVLPLAIILRRRQFHGTLKAPAACLMLQSHRKAFKASWMLLKPSAVHNCRNSSKRSRT